MSGVVWEDVLERLLPVSPEVRRYLEFIKILDERWKSKMHKLKEMRDWLASQPRGKATAPAFASWITEAILKLLAEARGGENFRRLETRRFGKQPTRSADEAELDCHDRRSLAAVAASMR